MSRGPPPAWDVYYEASREAERARIASHKWHSDPQVRESLAREASLRAAEAEVARHRADLEADASRRRAERDGIGLSGDARRKWFEDRHIRPT